MLGKPMAVMVNRGVATAETARAAAAAIGLPIVGEDPGDLLVTDGGNALIGMGHPATVEHALSKDCGSRYAANPAPTEDNTVSELVFVPHSLDDAAQRVADATGRPLHEVTPLIVKARQDQPQLSVFDMNGNLTTFTRPTNAVISGPFGDHLHGLLKRRGFDTELEPHPYTPTSIVGFTLIVSDIAVSERFYREVLGLSVLRRDDKISFDAGPIILRIQPEKFPGQVQQQREQKLLKDQLIFYVREIKKEVDFLTGRGVEFPGGIEASTAAGFVAYFRDPDGHNLWLWEPPTQYTPDMPINYFPVLERILREYG
jgi:catechol 2,3-dioxygenase-like lactoylglutathione lyase family enzyme